MNFWVLFLLVGITLAWTIEELEIFELNHQLKSTKFDDFYDFLNLTSKATFKQINKQFKKLSVKYHPDKVAKLKKVSVKKATKQYQFFQAIANVLKTPELKERYDYYLKNGFPKYQNNKWGFIKFKPGLVFVIVFLYTIIGVAHLVILNINYKQKVKKLQTLINDIKEYNDKLNTEQNQLLKENKINWSGQDFLVKYDKNVYLETGPDQYIKVTTDEIPKPRLIDAILFKLPILVWNSTFGKISESLVVDLSIKETKPEVISNTGEPVFPKKKRPAPKGEKLTLPNGKVIYSKNK